MLQPPGELYQQLVETGVIEACEECALACGWMSYREPPANQLSYPRISQKVRLYWVIEGCLRVDQDLNAILSSIGPTDRDEALLTHLRLHSRPKGQLWYAVGADIAAILLLSRHREHFDQRFFVPPFKADLMRILCEALELPWQIDPDDEENG